MKTARGFGDRLSEAVAEHGRLCVGIGPHPGLLDVRQLPYSVDGLERFATTCVEMFGDIVAVAEPQVALLEAYGSKGFAVLERTLVDLKDAGTLSTADAKCGDIDSTMATYAEAWLSGGLPLVAGALTVSPYLGFGTLDPAVLLALKNGRGLFVLAATPNPEGTSVQKAAVSGESSAQTTVNEAVAINAHQIAAGAKTGSIGAIVGTTLGDAPVLSDLRGPILMPGVGAQSGTPADVDRLAGESRGLTLPNISRTILSAGPDSTALWCATFEAVAPLLDKSWQQIAKLTEARRTHLIEQVPLWAFRVPDGEWSDTLRIYHN